MSLVPIEAQEELSRRFSNLRSVRWRIDLGILPSNPLASIDDLRRASADSRRRYASLRRKLLINPHVVKDEDAPSDLSIDNPLSQNPESTWGKYFRNAELEKTVDQDLTRLYPEDGSYFQTTNCQSMLRRILLLWALQHPQFGYRQGMHELLAPLVYVLHVDLDHLSQVKKLHEDCFADNFEDTHFIQTENPKLKTSKQITTFDDLSPEKKQIFLLSDPYGAEGELGVVLSEKFFEHDAYSMFDGLMDGGSDFTVSISEFFSNSTFQKGVSLPPVIEASSALYHLLSLVDPSLHTHLIELGVEPQYFALRWLRVLFGREFDLDDLLFIWDEIFSYENNKNGCAEIDAGFRVLCTDRGAFIVSFGVSMILHLRPALLATENVTVCLQKLLNFPQKNIEIRNVLVKKARELFEIAANANNKIYESNHHHVNKAKTPPQHHQVPSSYWEEKWRVLHKTESLEKTNKDSVHGRPTRKKSLRERFGLLSRTESDPLENESGETGIRRRLFDEIENKKEGLNANLPIPIVATTSKSENVSINDNDNVVGVLNGRVSSSVPNCISNNNNDNVNGIGASRSARGERESSPSSSSSSSSSVNNERENYENDTDKSSVTSNCFVCEIVEEGVLSKNGEKKVEIEQEIEIENEKEIEKEKEKETETEKGKDNGKEKLENRSVSGKFGWLFKFGKGENNNNNNNNISSNVNSNIEKIEGQERKIDKENSNSSSSLKGENSGDKKVIGTFKNLGQSMLDNIQVIESVFQQDRGKGQATAMAALTELRKISNLLNEM